jgi:hypothetical protein
MTSIAIHGTDGTGFVRRAPNISTPTALIIAKSFAASARHQSLLLHHHHQLQGLAKMQDQVPVPDGNVVDIANLTHM